MVPNGLLGLVKSSTLTRNPFASAKAAAFSNSTGVGPKDGLDE
jgi:hypothetical protein